MNNIITFICSDGKFNHIPLKYDVLNRSTYFKNLIECGTNEKIIISDIEYNVFIIHVNFKMEDLTKYLNCSTDLHLLDIFLFFMDPRIENNIIRDIEYISTSPASIPS